MEEYYINKDALYYINKHVSGRKYIWDKRNTL